MNKKLFMRFLFPFLFLLLFLFLFVLVSCEKEKNITLHTQTEEIPITVEIVTSAAEQAVGLMYRDSLEENSGMLFVFSDTTQRIFWMKNTKIPLDILFFDENGTLVDMKENFQPCSADPCELYYSKPAFSVLEVNAGFAAQHGIALGNTLIFE